MKKFVSICLIVTFLFIVTPPVFADNIEMNSTKLGWMSPVQYRLSLLAA